MRSQAQRHVWPSCDHPVLGSTCPVATTRTLPSDSWGRQERGGERRERRDKAHDLLRKALEARKPQKLAFQGTQWL